MTRYIVLLRGINVGGNNMIPMAGLKAALERQGFENVVTYLASGNVLLDADITDETALKAACEQTILDVFGLDIPVCVISAADLREAMQHAPAWWNKAPDTRHDAFFVIPPTTTAELFAIVGESKAEYERVDCYGRVIFWSAPMATFSRTRWSKITRTKEAYRAITVRNANTALKLAELAGGTQP